MQNNIQDYNILINVIHISKLFKSHHLTRFDNHVPLELLFHDAKLYKRHGTV